MLHLWWVLFCFCFALQIWDCCAGEYRVFSLFSLSHSSYFINHRSVTQSKKMIQQCIFLTDIYLLVICMDFLVCFVFDVLLFCGGQTGLKVEEFYIVYKKLNIVFKHHTNVQSRVTCKVEACSTVRCFCFWLYCDCQTLFTVYPLRRHKQTNWFKKATAWCIWTVVLC